MTLFPNLVLSWILLIPSKLWPNQFEDLNTGLLLTVKHLCGLPMALGSVSRAAREM